jgi:hypothetical protein
MGQEHTAAAEPLQANGVQRGALGVASQEKLIVCVPAVRNHFAASEAPDGNNHFIFFFVQGKMLQLRLEFTLLLTQREPPG